jgi:PTH1 family peptidyl-tRNA hydrolase
VIVYAGLSAIRDSRGTPVTPVAPLFGVLEERRLDRITKLFAGGAPPRVDLLVVGLGNPGDGYATTRHNVGFRVANALAKRARAEFDTKSAESRIAEAALGQSKIAIARPQTFMNDSGRAVRKLLDRYRIEPAAMLVVYDDVDLPLGKVRIREKGGPGTHNGMRSIVSAVGESFPRVRVGVAPADPQAEVQDLAEYVLSPFADDERDLAERVIGRAAEAVEVAIRDGLRRAMDSFNG